MRDGAQTLLEPRISIEPQQAVEIADASTGLDLPAERRASLLGPEFRVQEALSILANDVQVDPGRVLAEIDQGLIAVTKEQLDLQNRVSALQNPETVGADLGILIAQLAADGYLSAEDMALINALETARPATAGSNPQLEQYIDFQIRTLALDRSKKALDERSRELEAIQEYLVALRGAVLDFDEGPLVEPIKYKSSAADTPMRTTAPEETRRQVVERDEVRKRERIEEEIFHPVAERRVELPGYKNDPIPLDNRLAAAIAALNHLEGINPQKYGVLCDQARNELLGYVEGGMYNLTYAGSLVDRVLADAAAQTGRAA